MSEIKPTEGYCKKHPCNFNAWLNVGTIIMFCWKQSFFFFSTFVSDSGSLVLEQTKWWPYTWNMKILTIYIGLWSLHCQRGLPFSSSSWWRKSLVWWKHTWSEQVAVGRLGSRVLGTQEASCLCVCSGLIIHLLGITEGMDMSLSRLQELVMDRDAWRAAVQGITKCRTWLSDWTKLIHLL